MSDIDDDKNIQQFLKIRLLYFSFAIPHKVVFKDFAYFLGTVNLRSTSLLVRTISIACTIPCQRLIIPSLSFIGVVQGGSLYENSYSELFFKAREVIN